jgi:hypothetical protein
MKIKDHPEIIETGKRTRQGQAEDDGGLIPLTTALT